MKTFQKILEDACKKTIDFEILKIGIDYLKEKGELLKAEGLQYIIDNKKLSFDLHPRAFLRSSETSTEQYEDCLPKELFSPSHSCAETYHVFCINDKSFSELIWKLLCLYESTQLLKKELEKLKF